MIEERPPGRAVHVRVRSVRQCPPSRPALHLAAALPKGDRQSTLVSMATQLGLASFTPLATRRSVARAGKNAAERWQRVALAACKQSRNPWFPAFEEESTPETFAKRHAGSTCIVLHPGEGARSLGEIILEVIAKDIAEAGVADASDVALMVGPEGGFGEEEVAACVAAGALCARLGTTILRTETAAVAALAVLRAHLGD